MLDQPLLLCVCADTENQISEAIAFSKAHSIAYCDDAEHSLLDHDYALHFAEEKVYLKWYEGRKKEHFLSLDFLAGGYAHRRKFGGGKGQAIAKAVGVQSKFKPTILDCTAGQGGDAFVLAGLKCSVTMLERSPVAHALLQGALSSAYKALNVTPEKSDPVLDDDQALSDALGRMTLIKDDAACYLESTDEIFDVVYLDPMFPERKKSASVKKEMRVFHDLIGQDEDAGLILEHALAHARYRVVVKRSKHAPFLTESEPTFQLKGKSTRYDIYVNKALPS